DSGVRFQEDGEYTILVPGKEIDLAKAAATTARRIADTLPLTTFELAVDTEYEIQFLVSGSKRPAVLAVRVRTAKPPVATQPEVTPTKPPDYTTPHLPPDDTTPHLPPGVVIPR
ncbi:MAG: hypothetical protein PHU85_17430, partial [Phycisphaerae bacterium]|nr:hypothetical protein [Phycisphaerae bacterium]